MPVYPGLWDFIWKKSLYCKKARWISVRFLEFSHDFCRGFPKKISVISWHAWLNSFQNCEISCACVCKQTNKSTTECPMSGEYAEVNNSADGRVLEVSRLSVSGDYDPNRRSRALAVGYAIADSSWINMFIFCAIAEVLSWTGSRLNLIFS